MRLPPVLVAAIAALVLPQTARAAVLQPLKPCYVSVDSETRESVTVAGSGFTPGALVDVSVDGKVEPQPATVRPDGTIRGSVAAPVRRRGQRPFTLTVAERGRPANTVQATSLVTALAVRMVPQVARPSQRVRFVGRGFTADRPVLGHYVFGGELRKTVRFGRPHGPCGRFSVRRRQIPLRHPQRGRWTLQVDTQPMYSPTPLGVSVRLAITVRHHLPGY
jgi:hypothetical protein